MLNKERKEIEKLYRLLRENISAVEGSIFLKIIDSSVKTKIREIVKESSISVSDLDEAIIADLEKKNYIQRNPNDFMKFCITAKGLWEYEEKRNIINLDSFHKIINKNFFIKEIKPKTNENVIVLAALLFCRFYSQEFALKLDTDKLNSTKNDNWSKILIEVKKELTQLDLIPNRKLPFEEKKSPSGYVMARQDGLFDLSYNIYKCERRKMTHYLSLTNPSNKINEGNLRKIYEIIFEDKLTSSDQIFRIKTLLSDFANNHQYRVSSKSSFLESNITQKISNIFDEIYLT